MNKDMIYKQVKKLQLAEQLDIAIDILVDALNFTGANEELLINELTQIKKIITEPSKHMLEKNNE